MVVMTIDEKRLAEIRDVLSQAEFRGDPWRMCLDLLAMLDAERKRADEQNDRAENLEAAVAGLRLAIVDGICDYDEDDETVRQAKRQHDDATQVEVMRSEVVYARAEAEAAEKRAEDAERKLAALHAAAARYVHSLGEDEETHPTLGRVFVSRDDDGAEDALDEALADAAPVAERHDREVRVKELRRMAEKADAGWAGPAAALLLRDEADRIERGEA